MSRQHCNKKLALLNRHAQLTTFGTAERLALEKFEKCLKRASQSKLSDEVRKQLQQRLGAFRLYKKPDRWGLIAISIE